MTALGADVPDDNDALYCGECGMSHAGACPTLSGEDLATIHAVVSDALFVASVRRRNRDETLIRNLTQAKDRTLAVLARTIDVPEDEIVARGFAWVWETHLDGSAFSAPRTGNVTTLARVADEAVQEPAPCLHRKANDPESDVEVFSAPHFGVCLHCDQKLNPFRIRLIQPRAMDFDILAVSTADVNAIARDVFDAYSGFGGIGSDNGGAFLIESIRPITTED
jgi:hypothetical protein